MFSPSSSENSLSESISPDFQADQAKFFLAAIIESSQDSIVTIDFQGQITSWNQAAEELYGYPAAEAIGSHLTMLTLPQDLQELLSNIDKVRHSQRVEVFDSVRFQKGGREMNLEVVMSPVKNTAGEVIGVSTIARDVTEHREDARRESEECYRLLVEGTRDYAMFLMDAQRRIIHWNSGAERLFGWSREEAMGQRGDMIFTPEDRQAGAPEQEVQAAVRQGSAADIRWHLRQDGTLFWADGINTCLRDDRGKVRGFAKITRDATKEREAEEKIQLAHQELEQRVQQRTQALQEEVARRRHWEMQRTQLMQRIMQVQEEERKRISRELHDNLGQHVTALMLSLQALQNQEMNLPEGERRQGATHLASLHQQMEQLLSTTHRIAWELRPAALDNVGLEAALRQYVEKWERHGIAADFVSRFPVLQATNAETGKAETGLSAEAETALYRVVQEALTNVLRHAEASQVSVVLERGAKFVTAIVEDNGQGFDVEISAKSKRLGVLGMQERMELVGGTLEVESEPGSGTTIYARVPLTAATPDTAPSAS